MAENNIEVRDDYSDDKLSGFTIKFKIPEPPRNVGEYYRLNRFLSSFKDSFPEVAGTHISPKIVSTDDTKYVLFSFLFKTDFNRSRKIFIPRTIETHRLQKMQIEVVSHLTQVVNVAARIPRIGTVGRKRPAMQQQIEE